MCKWEVDSRLVSRKLVCLMILAVESGIHELGTNRQAVSVHSAGRRCRRPWATTVDGGHGVMGAICFVSCSRDGLLHCFNLSDVCTTYLPCDLLSFNGGKKVLLKKQKSEVRTSAVWVFEFSKNPRFLDNSSSRTAGSLTNSSSRTRVVETRKSI
jgi:hypothetical protein